MNRRIPIGLSTLLLPASVLANPPGEAGRTLARAARAVTTLQLETASDEISSIDDQYASDPDVLATTAMLEMHRGHYSAAAEHMRAAHSARSDEAGWSSLASVMQSTADATAGYETLAAENGRYLVSYRPGLDALIAPYALSALALADQALEAEFGYRHPGPIRLEIYPSAETLAAVSSLTVEAIETSGTIALCKWDRLMVTSPRALVRGYPWVDTIGHEFVHLVLARASLDHAPVWMQEGIAKFMERRWRGEPPAAHLDPRSHHRLVSAARSDQLLPFDRLHPSIALLPSQEDAALAFAQVATFIEQFYAEHGRDGLRQVIAHVREGVDAREAFAAVAQQPFASLELAWQQSVREQPLGASPSAALPLRLQRGESSETTADERDIPEQTARRFVRLGDLLFSRNRFSAAATEYGRALALLPDHPIIATRTARTSLRAGDGPTAITAIERVLEQHPTHAPALATLSGARQLAGDVEGARSAAREAIWINPFDPEPQCVLAEVASDEVERDRAAQACRVLPR